MKNINNLKYISQKEIKEVIHSYIEKELNSSELISTLSPATINIIENLAAGASSFMIYHSMMMKNERFLSTAVLESSIFSLAKDYSYNMSRAVSPKLTLIYNGIDTIILKEGQTLGTYGDSNLIYTGDNVTIEKGDRIQVCLGKYYTITENIKLVDNALSYILRPNELLSIDNDQIKIYINKKKIEISKMVEDFAVWNSIVDFSISNIATKLMICDNQFKYGKFLIENDLIELKYLETNGYEGNIDVKKIEADKRFLVDTIDTLGVAPEPISKIRELAPLFYTTQRRMVNEKDHIYIASSNPHFKSVGYKKDGGKPLKVMIEVADTTKAFYSILIDQRPYTYVKKPTDTGADIIKGLMKLIKVNSQVETLMNKDAFILARDSRNDTEITLSDGITKHVVQENVKPSCCTVYLYYVKHNVTDDPIELTDEEENSVADFLEKYKFEGVRILLLPASKIAKEIKVKIKVKDVKYTDEVTRAVKEILSEYELKVHTEFLYGEMLARVAKIEIMDLETKDMVRPVEYILPNQEVFDIAQTPDNYIKFVNIDINYIKD